MSRSCFAGLFARITPDPLGTWSASGTIPQDDGVSSSPSVEMHEEHSGQAAHEPRHVDCEVLVVKSSSPGTMSQPMSSPPQRSFARDQALLALQRRHGSWGRCEWDNMSANADRNCFLNICDHLMGIQDCEFSKWPTLTGGDPENSSSQHGLVSRLLELQHQFILAGAEGIQPAMEVARVVLPPHLSSNFAPSS